MRIHYIMHAEFEKPGIIEDWAQSEGHTLSATHSYRGEKLPHSDDFDFLIVLGGPQSACELTKYDYLQAEIQLITAAIANKKIILGICLGAQLLAAALGAKTERSPQKEIGIFPIELTTEGQTDPFFKDFPKSFPVMHWHGDMAGMPKDAVLLAQSEGCPHQAFRYGAKVYGLQFHFEITHATLTEMLNHCSKELQPSRFVQSNAELLAADFSEMNKRMCDFLNYLVT